MRSCSNPTNTIHKQLDTFEQNDKQQKKIISKQRQITRKRFSKNRNAFSESEASSLDELYKFKKINK